MSRYTCSRGHALGPQLPQNAMLDHCRQCAKDVRQPLPPDFDHATLAERMVMARNADDMTATALARALTTLNSEGYRLLLVWLGVEK